MDSMHCHESEVGGGRRRGTIVSPDGSVLLECLLRADSRNHLRKRRELFLVE